MRTIVTIIGLAVAMAAPVAVRAQQEQPQRQQIGPIEVVGFSEVSFSKSGMSLTGPRVYIHTLDGRFEAKAAKIVVTSAADGSPKTIAMTGDIWMLAKPDPGRSTEATSSRIDVDWAGKKEAVLSGNVHIKTTDPSMFVGPANVTADKAIVSLKPESQMGETETRIRIESDPSRSKLEFTPQSRTSEQK